MRRSFTRIMTILALSTSAGLSTLAWAKTDLTVGPFTDKTTPGKCPNGTKEARGDLDRDLQNQLIKGLMRLQRFQIQEREIRKIKPQHSVVGTIRVFDVCSLEGRGQKAVISLDVQLFSAQGA